MKESKVGAGRVALYLPKHPKANNRGYILKARYLVEDYLGRYLEDDEIVHHCNRNKTDDRIENLELMLLTEHTTFHKRQERKLDYGKIEELRGQGLGYKKIAKILNYHRNSVRSAIKVIKGMKS